MTMELPSPEKFDEGLRSILNNDVRGESLDHLRIVAMNVVLDGLWAALRQRRFDDAADLRRSLTADLIDAFAGDTEFSIGNEIEIGDSAFYLLQDIMTNYFEVHQLAPLQKLIGSVETTVAIDTKQLRDIDQKVGTVVRLGGDAMPDAPAILLENLRFITPEGKSHALKPQLRALIPLNLPHAHPRVAVPQERNASAVL